jgi:hypothetical protein
MLLRIPDDVSTASTKSSGDVQLEVVEFGSHATSERQGTVEGPHVGADAEASESATSSNSTERIAPECVLAAPVRPVQALEFARAQ